MGCASWSQTTTSMGARRTLGSNRGDHPPHELRATSPRSSCCQLDSLRLEPGVGVPRERRGVRQADEQNKGDERSGSVKLDPFSVLSFSFCVVVPGSSLCEVAERRIETDKRKTQNEKRIGNHGYTAG
jgi:hypothetical protein